MAFPQTVPIALGFLFLGFSYGMLMAFRGFAPIWPIMTTIFVFAGSMEFVLADLLVSAFNPLAAFLLAFIVNARHLFYGLAMLDKFKGMGKKKIYLIYGMCDETFTVNVAAKIPPDVDKGWFYFFVTLLNQIWWVCGVSLGALGGRYVPFSIEGIDFVLTALFITIFLDQMREKAHLVPGIIGLLCSLFCLFIFGPENFLIPSMVSMLIALSLMKDKKKEAENDNS